MFVLLVCAAGARGADAKWPVEQPYRIEVEIPAERSWKANVPVGITIDFARDLARLGAPSNRIDSSSILVVPRGGPSAIPHRLTGDWINDAQANVWWRTPDPSTRQFYVYFDFAGTRRWPAQAKPALVGVADSFLFNNGEPASTAPGDVDWDGDGLPDRIVCRTRVYEFGGRLDDRMGYGAYFVKNIGTSAEHLFDLPVRLRSPAGEHLLEKGFLYFNPIPNDWNADGHMDLVGFIGNDLHVMENTGGRGANNVYLLNQPRKVLSLADPSQFRAHLSAVVPGRSAYASRFSSFVDWEGDGDEDLLLVYHSTMVVRPVNPKEGVTPYGSFFAFFELLENSGRASDGAMQFAPPHVIRNRRGVPITASYGTGEYVDWDGDGDGDVTFSDDGGQSQTHVPTWAENIGTPREPTFKAPAVAPGRKTRAMSIKALQPHREMTAYSVNSVDWDGDDALDLVCTDYTGYVVFYRNVGSLLAPAFESAVKVEADGKPIYLANYLDPQADEPAHWGPQGPGELNAPAMSATVFDWDRDGDFDLFVVGQSWTTRYYENVGTRRRPVLARGRSVECDGDPYEFAWRSRVAAGDLDADGQNELVVLADKDRCFYRYIPAAAGQDDPSVLQMKVQHGLLLENGHPARGAETDANNNGDNHARLVDWDGDGDLDLLNASLYGVRYYENVGTRSDPRFRAHGRVKCGGEELHSSNHASACDAADWNGDGRLDLIVGAEGAAQLLLIDRSLIDNTVLRARIVNAEVRHVD